jgi:hypothetical protein
VGHDRPDGLFALVVRRHCHDPAKNLELSTTPVFDHIVQCGESGIDERAQVVADGLPTAPIGDAEIAGGVFREAVKTFAEGLVVDLLAECQEPIWRRFLVNVKVAAVLVISILVRSD